MKNYHKSSTVIKEFAFINIFYFILFISILPRYSWFNELIVLLIILYFSIRMLVSRNNLLNHVEFNLNKAIKSKKLSLFEVFAGVIIGEFVILVFIFLFRFPYLPQWIHSALFIFPMVAICISLEQSYRK